MNYSVLALKWRPKTFDEIVGQDYVIAALANSLSLGRIHHAYLFSGNSGIGKTSIARLLAKGLNCETGITAKPCTTCNNCLEIEHGRFIDLIEIDAASQTKVEDIRDLLENVQYTPAHGRFKIYLIDEIHMLSRYSFNALLKTLEEPPSHAKFLLATTDPQKLPITILSRCLHFHLKVIDEELIYRKLEHILIKEQITYESNALRLIACAANGSMRDALSLTDQAITSGNGKLLVKITNTMLGILSDDQALSLIEVIASANGERAMALINEAAHRGINWESMLTEMQILLHNIAIIQLSPSEINRVSVVIRNRICELASKIPPTDIQIYYQIILIGLKELAFAPNRRMGVEMTLLRALAFHPRKTLTDLDITHSDIQSDLIKKNSLHESVLPPSDNTPISKVTSQVLSARNQIKKLTQEVKTKLKKNNVMELSKTQQVSQVMLKRLELVTEQIQSKSVDLLLQNETLPKRNNHLKEIEKIRNIKLKEQKTFKPYYYEAKSSKISIKNSKELNTWIEEIGKLKLPESVKHLAINSWKEQDGNKFCLHIRSDKRYLNLPSLRKILLEALVTLHNRPIELTVVEDDNLEMLTPLEWQQYIYEKKLNTTCRDFLSDKKIKKLKLLFDAELEEDHISTV